MPDLYMPDHITESLRAEVTRLEARLRECRASNAQLGLNLARLADENAWLACRIRALELKADRP